MHGERRRGRPARVLYWFRTPPGVKVGRAALDEDAIRLLEELNPSVQFDWTRILKGDGHDRPEARDEAGRPDFRRRERDHVRRGPPATARASRAAGSPAAGELPAAASEDPVGMDVTIPAEVQSEVEPVAAPAFDLPDPPTAAHARLGAEGVLRLRGRYAELMRRLSERVTDAAQLEELRERAERLNPDTWVTADEVAAGLEQYEGHFEALRAVVGRPRRRRRRGGPGRPGDAPV